MLNRFLTKNKDLAMVLGMVMILIVLFSPIPAFLLDVAILVNFAFGLTILLLTFYVKKPVEFSTFPSLLLITTLFRLSLNIAATRLILTGGEAGEVIGSIGSFAVAGNFIVGLVVFFILVVVQYIVVTSGAQRVSEVAARFTLDSMPGQQMSIDADLNMGLIDQDEAKKRRELLEKEASFYGAMDGASKFVKGDSIAGIIILLIDIIAGWIIGVAQMGMAWDEALQTFTLLTIGDGIATQLPALIISIATGIIVTRSASDRDLSTEVFRQLSSIARIPLIVSIILMAMLMLPGMPKWPILVLLPTAGFFAWRLVKKPEGETDGEGNENGSSQNEALPDGVPPTLEIGIGSELSAAWKERQALILDRIASLRETHRKQFGIPFPMLKLVEDDALGSLEYEFRLFGTRYAGDRIEPEKMLAIRGAQSSTLQGLETTDPAFGLPAIWIEQEQADAAKEANFTLIDPPTVLITHLGEVMKREAATLINRAKTMELLEGVRQRQAGLIEEIVPNVLSVSDIQRIFQNLVSENVSIGNIDLIVEHLADLGRHEKDINQLTELLRQRMSYAICNALRDHHKTLAVLSLDPRIENQILTSVKATGNVDSLVIDPKLAQTLLAKLVDLSGAMQQKGRTAVLLCGGEIRRQLKLLTRRSLPKLAVLSVNEIPMNIDLESFDIVRADDAKTVKSA